MKQSTVTSTDLSGNTYEVPIDKLSWRPSAYAIVTNGSNILLISTGDSFHLPGGGIDLGEFPETAVVREVAEETGVIVKSPTLVGSLNSYFTYEWPDGVRHHAQSLLLYYACQFVAKGTTTIKLEDHELALDMKPKWIPLSKLDGIKIGSTVNWLPIVKQALDTSS